MRANTSDKYCAWYAGAAGASLRVLGVAMALYASESAANPVGPQVVSGRAEFVQNGSSLTVSNTSGAIINWQSFSIGSGEITRFVQPSAQSSVLNRVIGTDPSQLLGTLSSNGKVFLINPAGILVGAGARIDVAGFVASTLQLGNEDFQAGKFQFVATPGAGSVVNEGAIVTPTGGNVYLVGPVVENRGQIASPAGEILLAAGQSVQLMDTSTPGVRVEFSGSGTQAVNVGEILARSGTVGIAGALVRNDGVVNASQIETDASGRIFLRATEGATLGSSSKLEANGASGGSVQIDAGPGSLLVQGRVEARGLSDTGGRIELTGNRVALAQAEVDVTGERGGGTVLVGGDFHGAGAGVRNAWETHIGADVVLRADASGNGNGGQIAIWADNATRYFGYASARGGSAGGNGGLVETSGRHVATIAGTVDTRAPKGEIGTWLIDPDDITVVSGIGTLTTLTAADAFNDPNAGTNTISVTLINNATSNVSLQATNTVTFNAAVNIGTPGVGLAVQAGGTIKVSAPITTNGGRIILEADSPHQPGGANGVGQLIIEPNSAVTSNGGGITLIAGGNTQPDGGFVIKSNVNAGTGHIRVATSNNTSLGFLIGPDGQVQLSSKDTGLLLTTGTLTLGEAWTAGNTGQASGAGPGGAGDDSSQKLTVNSLTSMTQGIPMQLSPSSGSTFQLVAGGGGITLDNSVTTYQTTSINTSGTLTVNAPLNTSNHDLIIDAASVVLGASGSITIGTGLLTCTQANCGSVNINLNTWTGQGLDGKWSTPGNWSLNAVPNSTNNVVIGTGFGGITVDIGTAVANTVNAQSPVSIANGGSLTLSNASTFSNTLSLFPGGSLNMAGYVTVGGPNGGSFEWSGGAMSGAGNFLLSPLTAASNNGTLTGTLTLNLGFTNSSALTLSGATISGSGSITNLGTISSASSLTSALSVPLINQGIVDAQGTLNLLAGATHTGIFNVSSGGALGFAGGAHVFTSGGGVNASTGSTVSVSGAATSVTIGATGTSFSADTMSLVDGTVTVDGSANIATLNLTGGAIQGPGNLTVSTDFNQTAGTLGTTFNNLSLTRSGTFTVGSFSATGSVTLRSTNGSLVDGNSTSANVTAPSAALTAASGIDLDLAVTSLTASNSTSGNITLRSSGALAVGPGGVANAGGGSVLISTTSALALNGAVSSTGGTGSGNGIVLSATVLTNNAGSSALNAGSGRWLVYTADPGGNIYGDPTAGYLDSNNTAIWNVTYTGNSPASITQTGNRYLFAYQPTLTITSTNLTKTYGDDASTTVATAYVVTGYQTGVANAFLADVSATAYTGVPAIASAGTGAAASVAGGPYVITVSAGSLSSSSGYAFAFSSAGALTVNPAPLTVTATSASKTYDGLAYSGGNGVTYSGFVNNENTSALSGTLTFGGSSQGAVNAGAYAITPSGLSSSNYAITYTNGTLTVDPAALTVTANNATKTYDGLAFSGGNGVSYSGLVNGESVSVLGGTLAYGGNSQGAVNAGNYTIAPSGLASSNYSISYVDGALTVSPAPLIVTATNASKLYDGLAFSGGNGVSYSGLVNGESVSVLGGTLAYGGNSQGAVNAGNYTIAPSGLASSNYSISYADGTLYLVHAPTVPSSLAAAVNASQTFAQTGGSISATSSATTFGALSSGTSEVGNVQTRATQAICR